MTSFKEERRRIAEELTTALDAEARLLMEADRVATELTRIRARIASLRAEDETYAAAADGHPAVADTCDLSSMTNRDAIVAVLQEAKPELVRVRDLDRMLTARGKKIASGVSVDLTALKQSGRVLNPRRAYWTVP